MPPKFLIVNNGLRDLRGHYFETGVSVAEAAADAGLEAVLIAHADCSPTLLQAWPTLLPLCRTDHWMDQEPARGQETQGIQAAPGNMIRTTIDTLLAGEVGFAEYLGARLASPFETPRPDLRSRLKQYVPPVMLSAARIGRNCLRSGLRCTKSVTRGLLPPALQPAARRAWQSLKRLTRRKHAVEAVRDELETKLIRIGQPAAYRHIRCFRDDLNRIIGLTGAGRGDHVFLPTAHGRELVAVRDVATALGTEHSPTFHLEFRHALDFEEPERYDAVDPNDMHWLCRYSALHRVCFDWFRRFPPSPLVKVYTDTEELSEAYQHFSGLPFDTLPIPFRTHRIATRNRQDHEPICIAYLGDARDEKGFPWLPKLVMALREEANAGLVRFLFQASVGHAEGNPASAAALTVLRSMSAPNLSIVGTEEPLTPDQYFELLSSADVVLCPYSPQTYQRRSSGTLTEAITAGVPTVVPANTWLASQQPEGTGTTFTDQDSFIEAVRVLIRNYSRFAIQARNRREEWLAVHTPANLVKQLTGHASPTVGRRACA